MDNDVDIYADLPSINLNSQQNEHLCNCEELNKKLDLFASELEDLKNIKNNLEKNLSSLLKTAKAEIARKDKMIDDLRKRLDDTTFRRNRAHEYRGFSNYKMPNQQHDVTKQHENVPAMQEIESKSHENEFCQDENKNNTMPLDIDPQISTVFGERMHKRIVESVKEDEKQKLSTLREKEIAEESNKENGSQSSINESIFIARNPGTDTTYVKKSEKRPIEENNTYGSKRMKTEDNKDETASDKLYNNCVTQYDLKDDAHSFRKEQLVVNVAHRSASEDKLEDKKQTRSSNERKRDDRNDSRRDYDGSRRKESVDNMRNYRNASMSNHLSEGPNNEYKNGYRYSPSRRHYSKSRNDQESSSSHRLRERSSRVYRDRRYNDYEYSSRYRNDRVKKEYDNDKSRYTKREYGKLRDRFKHSSSDIEDNNCHKYKKHQSRETKESTPNISDNTNSYKQSDDTAAHTRDLYHLEEGEILDSPEKKNNCASILKNNEIINNNEMIVENKVKDDLTSAFTDDKTNVQTNVTSTRKQKVADVKMKEIKAALHLPRANLEDNRKVMQIKSCETNDVNTTSEDSTITRDATTIQQTRDDNTNDDNHTTDTDKKIKSSTKNSNFVEFEDTNNCNVKETDEIQKSNKSESTESSIKKEETDDPNIESVKSESNDDDHKNAKLENSPVELTVQTETVLNEDTIKKENDDETEVQDKTETCSKASDKSDVEMSRLCLSDHNYVRDPAVESAVDSVAVQKSPVTSDRKTETMTLKETKVKKVAEVIQSVSASKTTSSSAKSKKNQRTKGIVISRRRRVVTLSDSNASMTVLMNKIVAKTPAVNQINCNDDDTALKPRLRTANSRASSKMNPR